MEPCITPLGLPVHGVTLPLVEIFQVAHPECYNAVTEFYTENDEPKRAKRSNVPYINHINEGLIILERYGKLNEIRKGITFKAMCGFCLHPIFQDDKDVIRASEWCTKFSINANYVLLAMEYRYVANSYLSKRTINSVNEIYLSPIREVNLMLVADKVQNKKDFDRYHKGTHPRSSELEEYFNNWLTRLDISQELYKKLIQDL